jgi:hypothetical protein
MLLLSALGCSGASPATNTAVGAAVTTGIAVAAAAANRAATDECWGNCLNGFVCDKARGVCVPAGELKVAVPYEGDPEDDGCIEEDDGRIVCPEDAEAEAPEGDADSDADSDAEGVADSDVERDADDVVEVEDGTSPSR